jgi:hypothetical protein
MGQPLPDPYSDVTAENFPESLGGSHQRDSSYASMTVDDSTKSGRQSYYSSGTEQPYADMPNPFVRDADESRPSKGYQDLEYADPYDADRAKPVNEKASPFANLMGGGKYPVEQRIEDKKRGIGRQRYPFVVWALTAAMVGIFIDELVVNFRAQGSPVSFKPVVNPMLGPSQSVLINMGARFPPCMKSIAAVPTTTLFGCLNNTANPPDSLCSLEDICGFGGFHDGPPNQSFRFFTPIFLHAGFIHILLNMIAQLILSAQVCPLLFSPLSYHLKQNA